MSGDIVHIHQDKSPRLQWRLGKVKKLFPGRDGIIRSAEVVTLDPSNREKLYPLEVRSEDEESRERNSIKCR